MHCLTFCNGAEKRSGNRLITLVLRQVSLPLEEGLFMAGLPACSGRERVVFSVSDQRRPGNP